MAANELHKPVLLTEVITHLAIQTNGIYFDATFGRGGHTQSILERLGTKGRLLAVDRDQTAKQYAELHFGHDERFVFCFGSFAEIKQIAIANDVLGKVNGILLDLGVSSPQLDDPQRGFSFLHDGPLDMRMDTSKGKTAAEWLAHAKERDIVQVLFEYGEEKFAKRIARAIVTEREIEPIVTTARLASIAAAANPRWEKHKHPATRTFQAIRIWINNELNDLQACLDQTIDVLAVDGRLAVISFHSLEDRIVKRFIRQHSREPAELASLPVSVGHRPKLKSLGRGIKPQPDEIALNPRARSAILRIAEKVS